MDLALTVNGWLDEDVMYAQQLGAKHVFGRIDLPQAASPAWDAGSLAGLRNRIEKAGLNLAGMAVDFPPRVVGGQSIVPEGDTLDALCRLVEAAGAARIGLVCPPAALFPPGTLQRLGETTARAGVKLALSAGRPLAGGRAPGKQDEDYFAALMGSLDSLHNPWMGLDGTSGVVLHLLQESLHGSQRQAIWDRLFLVTLENERGRGSKSVEGRLDAGGVDAVDLCWCLKRAGYANLVRLGQQPHWRGDSPAGHRALAFGAGYLRAVLQAVDREG